MTPVEKRLANLGRIKDETHGGLIKTSKHIREDLRPALRRLENEVADYRHKRQNPPAKLLADVNKLREKLAEQVDFENQQRADWQDAGTLFDRCEEYAKRKRLLPEFVRDPEPPYVPKARITTRGGY